MASQTKMIIITSNEDLIQQFSANKTTNTHIIDLDNNEQVAVMTKDGNNIINLAFLAELSEPNSQNDHVYKRALDSPHHSPSKPAKMSQKSIAMICAVCGDRAIGFNYDILTCGPCKAFFRRNAHQNLENIRCLTGQSQCSIEFETRRKCTRCRLERCFAVGMRKDFILSEAEKQLKKERLEELRKIASNRSSTSKSTNTPSAVEILSNSDVLSDTLNEIDHLMMDMNKDNENLLVHENMNINQIDDLSLETLSVEDWLAIESIRTAFLSTFQNDNQNYTTVDLSNPTSALISWSHLFNDIALRFITFFRQIDEFENLDANDRFILIKYNLLSIYPVCRCFNLYSINDHSLYNRNEVLERHRRLLILCGASTNIHQPFVNLVLSLLQVTEQDPILLVLLMTILIFTRGLSMNEDEPLLQDFSAVNRAQCHYTTLLWNYLISKRGGVQAFKLFSQLINTISLIQSGTRTIREFFRLQMMSSTTVDRIAPLMQTVLHIS